MRQIYEIFIDLDDTETGVFFNSAVSRPAHEKAFYAFSKDTPIRCEFNDEKQNIIGVAISADVKIFRNHEELGEHYVVFTKDNVRKMAYKFMRDGNNNKLNFNHNGKDISKSAIGFMSYIIDTPNGFPAPKAFKGENEGSWLLGYHFTDKAEYERVKENFTGWSVEGDFYQKLLKTNKMSKPNKSIFQIVKEKLSNKFATAKLADGTVVKWEGDLSESTAIFVETEEGDVPAPDGEHTLEDGRVIVTEGGLVTSIVEVEAEVEDPTDEEFSQIFELMVEKITSQGEEIESLKKSFEEFKKASPKAPEKKKFANTDTSNLSDRQKRMLNQLKRK